MYSIELQLSGSETWILLAEFMDKGDARRFYKPLAREVVKQGHHVRLRHVRELDTTENVIRIPEQPAD